MRTPSGLPTMTGGGVAGWIPPGATFANGGEVLNAAGQPVYALGGTGSWYMESIGNTWGWDDGNDPQLDALLHVALPFSFTQNYIVNPLQTFAQAEFIDGAHIGCEFECANPLGYLGGWIHGQTPLESLLSGSGFTFPNEMTDTIRKNGHPETDPMSSNPEMSLPNIFGGTTTGTAAIWSGEPGQLNPLASLGNIAGSLTADPSANPIQIPNIGDVFTNAVRLVQDNLNDFNPFAQGSFLYWGAAKDYSLPSAFWWNTSGFHWHTEPMGLGRSRRGAR